MDLELMGRVAIVTGGIMGTGKACVEALASQGVRVATCGRGIEALTAAAEEISSKTETEVLPIQADLTNPEDVKRFIATAYDRFGRIDMLVNNATLTNRRLDSGGSSLDISDEEWWNHFNIKLIGDVRCVRESLPHMRERKWGRIINMAGGGARSGGGTQGAVNAAVINFTKVLSDAVAKDGITVNAIHPSRGREISMVRLEEYAERKGISIEEARAERTLRQQQRVGPQAEGIDVANMVLFLASGKAAAITGQTISVTGLSNSVYY